MPTREQLEKLIENKDFRRTFVGDYVQEMIATQIRALREHRGLSQKELGQASDGMKQGQVSRLEDHDYSGTSVNSLIRMAQAFDVSLIVRLAPFSEFLGWIENQSPDTLLPKSFAEEQGISHWSDIWDFQTPS